VLEVSSPGIDRPLTAPEDFARFAGYEARVELARGLEGRRRFKGFLRGLDGHDVLMDVNDEKDTRRVRFPYGDVMEAKLLLTERLIQESLKARELRDAKASHLEGRNQPLPSSPDCARAIRGCPRQAEAGRKGKRSGVNMATGISANRLELLADRTDAVAREKSIDKSVVIHAMEEAMPASRQIALRRRKRDQGRDRFENRRDPYLALSPCCRHGRKRQDRDFGHGRAQAQPCRRKSATSLPRRCRPRVFAHRHAGGQNR